MKVIMKRPMQQKFAAHQFVFIPKVCGEPLLAVSTVTEMSMNPLRQSASHIVLYRIVNGKQVQLLHRTSIEDGPV